MSTPTKFKDTLAARNGWGPKGNILPDFLLELENLCRAYNVRLQPHPFADHRGIFVATCDSVGLPDRTQIPPGRDIVWPE